MEKNNGNHKNAEYAKYSEDEQVLNLDELMDVQGGMDEKEVPQCGLGCYTGGLIDPTQTKDDDPRSE